jgi:putative ATPase
LWGPLGTGKTTLAQVIANSTKSHFVTISAILAGKADLRVIVEETLEH